MLNLFRKSLETKKLSVETNKNFKLLCKGKREIVSDSILEALFESTESKILWEAINRF